MEINIQNGSSEFIKGTSRVSILVGPAHADMDIVLAMKIHLFCLKYPGVRVMLTDPSLIVLRHTLVPTFQKILNQASDLNGLTIVGRKWITKFIYPESTTVVNDITYTGESVVEIHPYNSTANWIATAFDVIAVQYPDRSAKTKKEQEDSLNMFKFTKSRVKRNYTPENQLLAITNPSEDNKWIRDNFGDSIIYAKPEDSAINYNALEQSWTEIGKERIKILESLSQPDWQRLFLGQWVNCQLPPVETRGLESD